MTASSLAEQSVWSNRVFVKILGAYSISNFGDWLDHIAIAMLFGFVWKVNPMLIALIPIVYALPGTLLGHLVGVFCDKYNNLKLMIISDLLSAVLTALMAISMQPTVILLVLLIRSTVGVVYYPAQQTLTRSILSGDQLLKGVSLNGMVSQSAKIFGPILGAILVTMTTPSICLFLNSTSFLISALILVSVPKITGSIVHPLGDSQPKFLATWLEGWKGAISNRIVLYNMMLALLVFMTIQMVDTQLVVLLREQIPGKPNLFGWLISMIGIGALITITLLSRKTRLRSYALLLGLSTFLIGISFTWLSLTTSNTSSIVLFVSAFLAGIGTGLSSIGIQYLLIEKTDEEIFGRITGIYSSLTNLVFFVSPILGGILVTRIGVSLTFRFIGVSLLVIGFVRYFGGLHLEYKEIKIPFITCDKGEKF